MMKEINYDDGEMLYDVDKEMLLMMIMMMKRGDDDERGSMITMGGCK